MANIWPWRAKPKEEPDELDIDEADVDTNKEFKHVQPKDIDTSKKREYQVGHHYDKQTGDYNGFFVTDCFDDAELQLGRRPHVATFPVSGLYDVYEQKQRAEQYADYMNRINDAKQKAYEQTLLVDIIKDQV